MLSIKTAVFAAAFLAIITNTQTLYSIDPESVPIITRTSWCSTQKATCPLLCLQLPGRSSTTEANDCDPETLNYECICGNNQSPNASEYSLTLPYFLCIETQERCVASCNGGTECQSSCREDHPCGAQNPIRVNVTTTSSSIATATDGTPAGTDGVVYNGLGSDATTTPESSSSNGDKNGANTALDLGISYGLAVVLAGVFAGFALVM